MGHPHLIGLHYQSVGATSSLTKFSFVRRRGGIAGVEDGIRFMSLVAATLPTKKG